MRTDNSAQPLIGFPLLLLLICTTAMSGCDRRLPNPGEPMIAPQTQTPAAEVGDRSQDADEDAQDTNGDEPAP